MLASGGKTSDGKTNTLHWQVWYTTLAELRDSECIGNLHEQSFHLNPHKTREKQSSLVFTFFMPSLATFQTQSQEFRSHKNQNCINKAMAHSVNRLHPCWLAPLEAGCTGTFRPYIQRWCAEKRCFHKTNAQLAPTASRLKQTSLSRTHTDTQHSLQEDSTLKKANKVNRSEA